MKKLKTLRIILGIWAACIAIYFILRIFEVIPEYRYLDKIFYLLMALMVLFQVIFYKQLKRNQEE